MQRIGTVDELFVEGNPASGTKGTKVTADWLNSLQEEIAGVIEGYGGVLDPLLTNQLFDVINAPILALANAGGSALVGYTPAGVGAVPTLLETKLRELVTGMDFGAVGDGVTEDYDAIQAASAALVGPVILLPGHRYKYAGSVAFTEALTLYDKIPVGDALHDTFYINREVSNVGTIASQQVAAKVLTTLTADVEHHEVGIFSIFNDYAVTDTLQNVAIYGQATSLTTAGSPLWAGVFEVRNTTPAGGGSSVDHVLCGIEVDVCNGLAYSAVDKKIGVTVIAFGGFECSEGYALHAASDAYANGTYNTGAWRHGFIIHPNAINPVDGKAIVIDSDHGYGLQITGVSGSAAINLAADGATTYGMTIGVNYSVPISILPDKQIRLAHGVGAYGIEYASALGAVVLTAAAIGVTGHTTFPGAAIGANGAPPAQVAGYIGMYVNGTLQKVPYYN